MSTLTQKLNLVQPQVDDDIQQTIVSLAENFKILDDSYDESIANIETFLTSGQTYGSGKRFWSRNPTMGGFAGWVNIRSGVFAPKWKRQATYSAGDKVFTNINNGHYYECVAGGTSATKEPVFPTTSGATFNDLFGHTEWEPAYQYSLDDIIVSTVGDKSYYYKCILAGTSGNVEPSWRNIAGSTNSDGTCQWYVYKTVVWQEKGISCEFIPFGTVGGYAGADTIATVGTVIKGKWQADKIEVDRGGTGATTIVGARANLGATGKYAESIGDGTKLTFTINHNLGTQDVVVAVRENGSLATYIDVTLKAVDNNNVIVEFDTAPSANQYRVIIIG